VDPEKEGEQQRVEEARGEEERGRKRERVEGRSGRREGGRGEELVCLCEREREIE